MTEAQIDAHFTRARQELEKPWPREPMYSLAQAIAEANELKEQGLADEANEAPLAELREYLRTRTPAIRKSIDKLFKEVPCTPYAQLRCMELITGRTLPWGTAIDVESLARSATNRMRVLFVTPWEKARDDYNAVLKSQGPLAAYQHQRSVEIPDARRWFAAEDELYFEQLRIFQHLEAASLKWGERPSNATAPSFQDLFNTQWSKVDKAIKEAGYQPRDSKGKGKVIAGLHAACDELNVKLPPGPRWPEMLKATFPDFTWGKNLRPTLSDLDRESWYQEAYDEVQDRLRNRE